MKKVKTHCIVCGAPLTGDQMWLCSKRCRVINQSNLDRDRYNRTIRNNPLAIAAQNRKASDRRKRLRSEFMAKAHKSCPECGQSFRPKSMRVIYCSRKCGMKRQAKIASLKIPTPESRRLRAEKERRRKLDFGYRLKCNVSKSIWQALRRTNRNKRGSTQQFLPYSMPQLKAHLESFFDNRNGFTWENYGKVWQIDHIIPQAFFHYTSMDSKAFRDCWALTNLIPASVSDNQEKGARRVGSFDNTRQGRLFA